MCIHVYRHYLYNTYIYINLYILIIYIYVCDLYILCTYIYMWSIHIIYIWYVWMIHHVYDMICMTYQIYIEQCSRVVWFPTEDGWLWWVSLFLRHPFPHEWLSFTCMYVYSIYNRLEHPWPPLSLIIINSMLVSISQYIHIYYIYISI